MTKSNFTQAAMDTAVETDPVGRSRRNQVVVLGYALGLMVSPDNIALLGRFAGHFGIYTPLLLAAGAWVYLNYARGYADLNALFPGPAGETLLIRKALGAWLAYYPLVVRVMAAVFLTTGLMVSCGYVFNEVFVYWFPNFGFAFILLGLLSALHLLKPGLRASVQTYFVGTAFLGLTLLICAGLVKGPPHTVSRISADFPVALSWLFMPLIFFIGFDIATSMAAYPLHRANGAMKSIKTAIIVFGVLIISWAMVATQYVTASRLTATSISHIIAAREILGQSGRIIMGLIVIAGACAAANALFETLARLAASMSEHRLLPRMPRTHQITVLCAAAIAAIMMAGGLAGEKELEIYIRATLLLWLGGYGLLQACLLKMATSGTGVSAPIKKSRAKLRLSATAIVTFGGVAILALTGTHAILMFKVIMAAIGCSLVLGAIGKRNLKPSSKDVKEKGENHAKIQH